MTRLSADQRREQLERFHGWLTDHRQPVTRQRDLIAELIFSSDEHLSVERLSAALSARGHVVGTATIYRTLELLERAGLVRAHSFGGGSRRYEAAAAAGGADDHGHFICDRCGRVIEFTNDQLSRLMAIMADEHGFQHQRHRIEITGTCRDCFKRDLGGFRK